jgi:MFS family permease
MKTGLTFNLTMVSLSSMLYNIGFSIGTTLIILYLVDAGYSPFLAGMLLTFSRIFHSIAMMATGSFSDRIGRKRPIILGSMLTGLCMIAMAILTNHVAVAILLALVWLGTSFQSPAVSAAVTESSLVGKTAIAFGWYQTLWGASQILGQGLAGFTAQNYGYNNALILGGAISLIGLVFIFNYKEKHQTVGDSFDIYEDFKNGLTLIKNNPRLLYLSISISFHTMGFMMFFTFIPLVAQVDQGLSKTAIGLVLAMFSVGSTLSVLIFGVLTTKIGSLRMLTIHLIISSMLWWIYPWLRSFGAILLLMASQGIIGAMDMPARRELIRHSAENDLATAMGVLDAISLTVGSLGGLVGGALWETGHWIPFMGSALVNTLGVLFLLKLRE